ncbi:MAG TPA: protein kinase [Candidatus Polarisedimenticolaceae bacterium]|nr:protein kinase [Candidatus Polarisedimenticolaceae bacterium]
MSLIPGSKLGPYEITGPLGEGGMGAVYRATDTKLRREVAIKVLPEAFTQDAERLARFEREAVTLAQLHHPHIASIFGLEESSGVRALVMELVPGPTLAERLASGPLPVPECIAIGRQIAEALEEAHEKGIVHRDLKPQNVKAPVDGKVKVLDFGLAKAMDGSPAIASGSSPTLMNSPTMTSVQGTQLGMILGTAAYMAPEQARGGAIDRRADIWAFGVVLYEMLTGVSPFEADTVSDTLAGVLKSEIDFSKVPASTPAAVRHLLRRCLERNPKNRLRDIGDARIILQETTSTDEVVAVPSRANWIPWAIALVAIAAAIVLGTSRHAAAPPPAPRAPTALGIVVPPDHYIRRTDRPIIDLSADGRMLLFLAEGNGPVAIMKRPLDRLEATEVPGTTGADEPRLSPDGRWIAFFADGSLRKVPVDGGTAVILAEARAPRGLSWTPDGSLIYSPLYNGALKRVPATGGSPVDVTKLDPARAERSHRWPQVLPGGKTVIFTVGDMSSPGDYDGSKIDAVDLASGKRTTILEGARMARYTAAGYLVYQHQDTLMAVRFDADALKATGSAFAIQEHVGGETSSGAGFFAVSEAGVVALAPKDAIPSERALVLVDRQGHETELAAPLAEYNLPRVSPDGKTLAVDIGSGASADDDIYLMDFATQHMQRLTFNQGHGHPLWTPDGKWIIYTRGRSGSVGFAKKAADGTGAEILLKASSTLGFADAWLAGGQRMLLTDASESIDVKILEPDLKTITPLFATPTASEYAPAMSPDGRFVAYTSTESGSDEVYVETIPTGGGRWQVSTGGGLDPVWSHDGREIFFLSGVDVMAAAVDTKATFRAEAPKKLFGGQYDLRTPPVRNYDITADGRFLMIKRKFLPGVPRQLVVLDGWQSLDPAKAKR